jgi:hypothetical protein
MPVQQAKKMPQSQMTKKEEFRAEISKIAVTLMYIPIDWGEKEGPPYSQLDGRMIMMKILHKRRRVGESYFQRGNHQNRRFHPIWQHHLKYLMHIIEMVIAAQYFFKHNLSFIL